MDSGDDQDVPDPRGRKKRYHRHTPRQIQTLESMFKVCPHPDEKQRMQLSRDLGLEPRQIKFWFQNRRTQMKAQQDRSDNCLLRAENDKIRCENIAMREALKNIICPSCGSSSCTEDSYFDESKLRMENTRLKEQLDRVSSLASRYLGRPMTQLPPVLPVSVSSLDLSVGGYNNPGMSTSLDLNLLLQNSSCSSSSSFPYASISELEKPIMVEMAGNAMEEVIRLVQTDEPLWMKSISDGRDILQLETYDRMFKSRSGHRLKFPDVRIEASRDTAVVAMNATTLIDMFMDASKWCELFPTIVSKARTIEVLGSGTLGGISGSLALMYEELQVLSPVVPTREFCFLRCCQPIQQGVWVVADVSVDFPRTNQLAPASQSKKLPSGCLVEEMADGYAKVTWVEHVEIEENDLIPALFKDLMDSGLAFGAQRWLATLHRMCERFSCLTLTGLPTKELGVSVSPDGKRSMMKLAQRMANNFCANIGASNDHKWITLSGLNDVGVRVTLHKSTDAGQPSGVLLSAATTIWFPISPESVFAFFKDERTRTQWDVLSNGNSVQEVTHILNGSHPGNCISLLRGLNSGQNTMLILQECCTDASGSVVVYSPIDIPAINVVMSGEDPSFIPLLPSGFTILPDGRAPGASSSSNPLAGSSSGSLVTIAFQILMSSLPSAKLNLESVTTVNSLIGTTVQQIKAALNCPDI